MNKDQFPKNVGQHVRLQPPARKSGVALADFWLVQSRDDRAVTLQHLAGKYRVRIGYDAIRSYTSDPNSDNADRTCGWLALIVQVDVAPNGTVDVSPLILDALGVPQFSPLHTSTGQLVASRYAGLPRDQRAAVAYVLITGGANPRQTLDALKAIGYSDIPADVLDKLKEWTQLVFHDYFGVYSVNPAFRSALEELIANDSDLDHLRRSLR